MSVLNRRPDAVGRAALDLYRSAPASVRTHVAVRWWTAPFPAIAAHLPAGGRVVEIGCGHGLFSAYAALSSPGREVVGVDIDGDKIEHAQAASRRLPGLDFRLASSGALPPGPWDAVVFVDVLYLLPADEQQRLLAAAVAALAPGGRVLVKEMGTSPRWKVGWNLAQETVSVKVLRITEGSSFDFVPPEVTSGWLVDLRITVEQHRLDRGRVHPHHLLVARLPAESAPGSTATSSSAGE